MRSRPKSRFLGATIAQVGVSCVHGGFEFIAIPPPSNVACPLSGVQSRFAKTVNCRTLRVLGICHGAFHKSLFRMERCPCDLPYLCELEVVAAIRLDVRTYTLHACTHWCVLHITKVGALRRRLQLREVLPLSLDFGKRSSTPTLAATTSPNACTMLSSPQPEFINRVRSADG